MFQQFLVFDDRAPVLYTGIHPTGRFNEPCDVRCSVCNYAATAPTMRAAARLAFAHDWKHHTEPQKAAV